MAPTAPTELKVGCCGLAGMGLSRYAEEFEVVELQSTFYRLPKPKTAKRWRESVRSDFEFTMKVFQGVTHPVSSPTWRRAGSQKPEAGAENYGYLKPTEENFGAWKRSMEICDIIDCKFCVVQLPPSFANKDENVKNLEAFFSSVERNAAIGIELRHRSWFEDTGWTRIAKRLELVHIVDPFMRLPLYDLGISYFRLHGLGKRPYAYRYSDEELKRLSRLVKGMRGYVMFNNIHMREDAKRFLALMG